MIQVMRLIGPSAVFSALLFFLAFSPKGYSQDKCYPEKMSPEVAEALQKIGRPAKPVLIAAVSHSDCVKCMMAVQAVFEGLSADTGYVFPVLLLYANRTIEAAAAAKKLGFAHVIPDDLTLAGKLTRCPVQSQFYLFSGTNSLLLTKSGCTTDDYDFIMDVRQKSAASVFAVEKGR